MSAAVITGFAAVVALIVQYLTNDRALKQQAAIAREQRDHERDQALEARRQERLQDAYFGLVGNFYRQATFRAWVQQSGPPTPTNSPWFDLPSAENLMDVTTRAIIFGSPQVRQIIERWREAARINDVDELQVILGGLMLRVNLELTGSPNPPGGLEVPQS